MEEFIHFIIIIDGSFAFAGALHVYTSLDSLSQCTRKSCTHIVYILYTEIVSRACLGLSAWPQVCARQMIYDKTRSNALFHRITRSRNLYRTADDARLPLTL